MFNLKKVVLKIFVITIIAFSANSVYADTNEDVVSIDDRIAAVGFEKIFTGDPQKEITNLFKKLDSYTEKKDLKKIKSLFSDDFVNNDGFDIDVYMKSMKSGFTSYENRKVTTKINSISVNDNYAVVHVTENGEAETPQNNNNGVTDSGLVLASANVYYYLQRDGHKWKIFSANVLDESCSILYGAAKNIYFSLNVPTQVKASSEYTASLAFAPMKDMLVSAALSSEPVIYPLPVSKEAFRTVKNDGVLERIFTANSDNYNEYVIASIGISKPKMLSPTDFKLELAGTAFVVRRVNIFKPMPQKIQSKKNSADKISLTTKNYRE